MDTLILRPKPHRRIVLKKDAYVSHWGVFSKHTINIKSTERIAKTRYTKEGIELLIRNETRYERFLRIRYHDNVTNPLPTEYYPKEKSE